MLTEDGKDSRLFGEISALVGALGLRTVEVTDTVHQGAHSMRVVVSKDDGDVTTDDLAAVYGIIYPRYSVILSDRDLQLEVSSPGLQRTLKDVLEFEVFRGRLVRVYSISRSAYAVGRIAGCSSDGVTLSECERRTGTRTQVQHTRSSGRCMILRPSFWSFISSEV